MPINLPTRKAHHGSSRLIRHAYGEGEKYVPLVLRAQQLWDELAEISGEAVFERTGVINLGPASSAFLANVAASARAFQLEVEELDAQAVMQRWPEIRSPMTIGRFSNPLPAYCAANWPSKPGSVWRGKQAARSYSTVRSRLFITMLTGSPSIPSTVNIMVKSCWSRRHLGHPLLPDLPIQPVRKVFAWYQADGRYSSKNHFPAFTGELPNGDQYYGFPAEDNELKIGKHNGGQPISTRRNG
ncbi:N-methyl-L-tryptophan oxidase [Klebsiella pneumoniae]|uniref:N-methyl-L-tryptophan oxidase n=1 Tax=Klebsiella pneumoniae TaxID=573 RepID=A0A377XQE7_KLEPN|nr:N-methyl-L-tryptophan oxidase [Klebsiella pneumoniae]